jgi:hypothetical protein
MTARNAFFEAAEGLLSENYPGDVIQRCVALLANADVGPESHVLSVGDAKNKFSALLQAAREGRPPVIGVSAKEPVVMMSMTELVRLMCSAATEATGTEVLLGMPLTPALTEPLRFADDGELLQLLPLRVTGEGNPLSKNPAKGSKHVSAKRHDVARSGG